MNDEIIKELDDESLVELLQSLEQLDSECKEIVKELQGDDNE